MEYRYLLSRAIGGNLKIYFFNFKPNPEQEDSENAYIIRFVHNQPLPLQFNMKADIDYQSSFDFLREFDNNFRRAVVSNRRSQVHLSRSWSYFNLTLRASRFETYFKITDTSIIRNNLPEIKFNSSKIKLFSPLYFSFYSSFDRWEHGWDSEYEKETQKKSQSLAFSPALTLPVNFIPWLTLNSFFSANFSYYFQSYAPSTKTRVNEPLLSHNYEINTEITGPVFFKIYSGKKSGAKMKHIIEPHFSYRYESPVASSDRIITSGLFYRNHSARYGLTNHLLIQKNKMPREILTLGLSQSFYFDPENSPLQNYSVEGEVPEFSDIQSYLRFYPSRKYSIDISASFNPYYNTFSRLRLGANFGLPEDNFFLRVNWYKSINPYREDSLWDRHQIGFFGGFKIPRLSLEGRAEFDFNIKEKEMLYAGVVFTYHYQCVDLIADVKIFYFREKPEMQFRISFGLGNIGKTTDFFGGTRN
ncbi:LPS assembly protein LptD [Acidobacteriota bacterium]